MAKEIIRPDRLTSRMIQGGFRVFFLRLINQALYFVKLIVLARLLAPRDFGLMGIALLTMAILDTFTRTGFQESLIQKKENTEKYLDSAWTLLILRGLLLFIILFLSAPAAASFFKTPEAAAVVRVFGISVLLGALTNIGVIYFQKELEFHKQFLFQLAGILTTFVVTITLAILLRNVWALVLGMLTGNGVQTVLSYVLHPYRPRFNFDRRQVKELFGFGKWVMGSSILVFLVTQGDDIFVGKLLGAAMLGLYQVAYKISNAPTSEVTHALQPILFPAFAKLQDNIRSLRETYLQALQFIAFLSFPLAGLIVVLGPDFTRLFLGEKWLPMIPALQALALAGMVRALLGSTGPLFYGMGKPKIETLWEFVRLLVMLILIFPLTMKWGILGTSLVVLLSVFISGLGFSVFALRLTGCPFKGFIKVLLLPLAKTLAAGGAVWTLRTWLGMNTAVFIFLALVGIVIYVLLTCLFERAMIRKLWDKARLNLGILISQKKDKNSGGHILANTG